jgi:hypothetical protein
METLERVDLVEHAATVHRPVGHVRRRGYYAGRLVIQVNYDYIAPNRLRVLSRDDRPYITPRGPAIVDLGRVPVSELPSGSIEVIRGDRPICEERSGHG